MLLRSGQKGFKAEGIGVSSVNLLAFIRKRWLCIKRQCLLCV